MKKGDIKQTNLVLWLVKQRNKLKTDLIANG